MRAWASGVGGCFLVLFTLVSAQLLTQERWSWHAALDMPLAFSLVFAAVLAVLYVPVFVVIPRILGRPLTRSAAIIGALLLAPVAPFVIGAWVGERWDLQALGGASIPFAFAGVVFAMVWTRRARR